MDVSTVYHIRWHNAIWCYLYSNEAELDLDAERPAKRARSDEDSTDFSTMASLAKGEITQVPSLIIVIVHIKR